jgi:hypothetical protein
VIGARRHGSPRCAGSPPAEDYKPYRERATTQGAGDHRVTVAVPTAPEAAAICGVDPATKSIQPVWVEIQRTILRPFGSFPPASVAAMIGTQSSLIYCK